MTKRITGLLICLSIIISCFAFGVIHTAAANTSATVTATDYGLPQNIEDGNILQCFNWKYSDIKNELKGIAEAGFTSVQTSPAQPPDTSGKWYWLYQPCGFYIASSNLGSKEELKSLCTEAKKYGIKVIVDIVANHLTGDHGKIQNDLKDGRYWHNKGKCTNWKDRTQLTQYNIGDYADLKTEDSYVQSVVKKYLNELKSIGVSGFRFDAAKHIATPAEGDNFFKMVKDVGLWSYGEILDSPGGNEANVLKEYTKYIDISDTYYSGESTGHMRDGKIVTNAGRWKKIGVDGSKIVYWPESHDTYANDGNEGWTKNLKENILDRSYAVLGSRADAQALYLSRPSAKNREDIYAGNKGSTHYKTKEVAAVNHFKNALVGRGESYTYGDGCNVVCREGGAVVACAKDSNVKKTVPNADGLVLPGTYTDEITGNKWTVTETTMTGTVGSTGIAVFYSTDPYVRPTEAPPTTAAPTTEPTTAAPTQAPTESIGIIGDSNGDKNVTIKDATLIQKSIAGLETLSGNAKLLADVNGNKSVEIKDATCIQKYVAMLDGAGNAGKAYEKVIT